jgi:hypothetical protein
MTLEHTGGGVYAMVAYNGDTHLYSIGPFDADGNAVETLEVLEAE